MSATPPARAAAGLAGLAGLALVAGLATACGDDAPESDGAPTPVAALTADQIATALIAPENLGDGWRQTPSDHEDDPGPGCVGEVSAITDELEETDKAGYDYTYGPGVPIVSSQVTAYPDADDVAATFDRVQEVLGACSTVTGTDGDGAVYDLTVTYDDAPVDGVDGVDDQATLRMTGTVVTERHRTEISQAIAMYRIGANVVQVGMVDLGGPGGIAEHPTYARIGLDRALAVVDGEEPPETTAPAPE
ncbi:hypothetical protein [Nocardioides sp. YIM 152588]|uniref:hypothetical protein n=1 Tax=Nocardioides sp. YIM 152588 TaxID=3158259 RepID=UPI0032E4FDB9